MNAEQEAKIVQPQTGMIVKLTVVLEDARRAGKRQAEPLRQSPTQAEPQRPGRKHRAHDGQQFRLAVPSDNGIDKTIRHAAAAGLPVMWMAACGRDAHRQTVSDRTALGVDLASH